MNLSDTNILEPIGSKKTFFSHVFSTTEEGKAEILNVAQYSLLGIIPIILLNKLIQRFIPDADADKSSVEVLIEVLIQLIVMFVGIIIIHRMITFIPTYSEFKYESLTLTNVILAFMILVLSIQTKIGIKVNILVDRVMEMWNGQSRESMENKSGDSGRPSRHTPSRADNYEQGQMDMFPPAVNVPSLPNPVVTSRQDVGPDLRGMEPMSANSMLGGSFGSSF